ncbi:hypothetical protein EC973_008878 [Apophysomyces ossiformis]|uniref:G-protein coupled receptors family 2 profile 2 domain-containing protein n=1 Tax=Apophysomyces ossiformis TaxID=679940 RepID=A0A8H7BZ44_9FUNG|nr:hypothetical protein EC973_008878 [Apophysomyces ossiformis]
MAVNITDIYPNTPTPHLPVDSWDFDPGHQMVMSGDLAAAFPYLNLILNSMSIAGGSSVCIILLLIRAYDKSLVDRVSLRLTAVVSAVDAIKAAAYIVFTYVGTPGAACGGTAWMILFLTNLYTFLSVAIAFNLQWIFIQGKAVESYLEIVYFSVSVGLALATSVPPWAAGRLGLDENYGACWFVAFSSKRNMIWEWCTFLGWNLLGSIYCFFVVIAVVVKLRKNINNIKSMTSSFNQNNDAQNKARRTQRMLNKLAFRISLYALIPLVTQGGWYICELIQMYAHVLNDGFTYWSIIGTDLPGVLNLLAFCLDPALSNALRRIKNDMLDKYGDVNTDSGPNSKRGFKRWMTRTFIGTKKVDATDSPFYRMSATDNTASDDTGVDFISTPHHDDLYAEEQHHQYPTTQADSQSTIVRFPDRNQTDAGIEMQSVSHASSGVHHKRRKNSENERIRKIFRGL